MTESASPLETLVARGEEEGCVNLSQLNELVAAEELDDEELGRLYERLEERGIEVSDDCGREQDETHLRERRSRRRDDGRAPALPQRGRPLPAADRGRGGRAGQADRARRRRGEGADDQLEPAPRRLDRQALPGPRAVAARPDPGGHHRPDPRRREVRLAPGVQVLDLRDLVDPAGRPARRRQQVAHDPDAGPHRSSASSKIARAERSSRRSSAGSRPTRRSPSRRSCRSSSSARCARPRGRSPASTGRSGENDSAFGDLLAADQAAPEEELDGQPRAGRAAAEPVAQLPERERRSSSGATG